MVVAMKWFVSLLGDSGDLEELAKVCTSDDLRIEQREQGFILKTTEFDSLTESEEVLSRSKDLLTSINGGARILLGSRELIRVGSIHRINEKGGTDTYIHPDPIELKLRVMAVTTIVHSNGTREIHYPAGPIPRWASLAKKDVNVARVLRLHGTSTDWTDLYRIYEIIQNDLGGEKELLAKDWVTRKAVVKFRHTANSPSASGDKSRHGVGESGPADPMTLSEANSIIEGIIYNWLRYKLDENF
jgi:hypothetical protein